MGDNKDFNRKDEQFDIDVNVKRTEDNTAIRESREQVWFIKTRNIVYYILGVIEVLLFFRLFFRLLGANQTNMFITFLYSLTKNLVAPFYGIFKTIKLGGPLSLFVFEPGTVVAMIVYAILSWGVIKLLRIRMTECI